MARDLPVHHVQMILYAHYKLYCDDNTSLERQPGMQAINSSWAQDLREVDTICRALGPPQSQNPLLSVQTRPRFTMVENEVAVMESLKLVTAVPQLRAEVLPWRTGIEVKQYHEAKLAACADSSASGQVPPVPSTTKQRTLCQVLIGNESVEGC
ncbi:hypothetical protein F5144DRAFT_85744 [Chaetomium tenue]|uniref:Uncharacterized protein n=1 Tax=Chaetomium tenue TaxID=1854479 RepID=A0ACB7PHC7_9PEZI|nr:hypothetical protein F5144DRAFT_85744 [Chaetomium globosum]